MATGALTFLIFASAKIQVTRIFAIIFANETFFAQYWNDPNVSRTEAKQRMQEDNKPQSIDSAPVSPTHESSDSTESTPLLHGIAINHQTSRRLVEPKAINIDFP